MKIRYTMEGVARVTAEFEKGSTNSKHIATDFFLEVSDNLKVDSYMDKEDKLTAEGCRALTQCFVQGLIGNITFANQEGYRNDAEHLRYIISELERGFVAVKEKCEVTDY